MALKVALLEDVLKELLVDRFNSMPDPVASAVRFAQAKSQPRRAAEIDLELEAARQAVAQEFFDSVVIEVRKHKPVAGPPG